MQIDLFYEVNAEYDLDFVDLDYDMLPSDDEVDRFQNHIEGMEHEVKTFFEDEVIPNLIG